MIRILTVLIGLALAPVPSAAEFRHFANFSLKSHFKITGDRVTPIPMKPILFDVSTDGVRVRITAAGDNEARTTFEIYRSDGVGRQRSGETTLDVIAGIQAMSTSGGVLRHLRLTRESLTITTFPGVSDQTIITHAVAAAPSPLATATTTKTVPSAPSVPSAPHAP
ncbi:MAG: hypothetical protein NTW21_40465 [Verrucomicrobia bacterium]|nr:hypothetical protein [Verrucomicrobiota bacterium]